jgi:hypothetical protein
LVGNYPVIHGPAHDSQHFLVEEKFGSKTGRRERHGQEMPMRAAVRRVAVGFKVRKQDRPKGFPAGVDEPSRKMPPEDAVAIFFDFEERIFDHRGLWS